MAIIVHMNASRIMSKLYQGAFPSRRGRWLYATGIDVLVLCAREHQVPASDYPGVEVIYCPLDDSEEPLDREAQEMVFAVADKVARRHRSGKRVLVTCHLGINRSGLVTGIATTMITGCTGVEALKLVRRQRPGALSNRYFAWLLSRVRVPMKSSA